MKKFLHSFFLPSFVFFFLFTSVLSAKEKNKISVDDKSGKPILLGLCDRTAFADSNFSWWFDSEMDMYSVDSASLKDISVKMKIVKITLVMGTWCSDSKREVPRFYKILDLLGYDQKNLTLICVDRNKKDPAGEAEKLDIKLVPTFIFYRDSNEIGRIIETPKESLEKDLTEILLK
ncbi:MAG: thiol reductase thioredoxin [Ignavibacteriae bacterium HGW-Ignavibacteriae-3]|nr:MAG: thiol reductase thioredoxin [Ignavibacteriae bacterium HGW-Ignavibacteriae-3]